MAIRVQTIGVGPGTSADLTDSVVGLSWSNINPGGDERCTFQLKRQWFAGAPEIAQGNLLRITDGPGVLGQFRIEENDRAVSDSEYIGVTAYGLGTRLKDTTMTEIYADRDAGQWGQPPFNRQATFAGTYDFQSLGFQSELGGVVAPIPASGLVAQEIAEVWYTAPTGVTIAKVGYKGATTTLPASWTFQLFSTDDDAAAAATNLSATFDNTLRTATLGTPRRYLLFELYSNASAATTSTVGSNGRVSVIAVYGNHGLTLRSFGDSATPDGLYGPDIVSNVVGKATGITLRRNDANTYVLPHFVVYQPTPLEDVVTQVNQYIGNDWGTWGPDSVLDTSTNGYFDYKARDTATAHWYIRRSDCDDVALQVELASSYNQVDVVYSDPTTTGTQIATRTTTNSALSDAGITRKAMLQGGTLTPAGANQLGDIFLALTSGYSPARGSIRLTASPTHYQRGKLPPWFMRADGSNIRVPDVLPSKDALSLSTAPDRRTTFPIKRVEVDASGQTPIVSVEVDQTPDQLSVLQARLGLAAQFPTAATPQSSRFSPPNRRIGGGVL